MRFDAGATAAPVEHDEGAPDDDADARSDEAASDLAATRDEDDLGTAAAVQADHLSVAA